MITLQIMKAILPVYDAKISDRAENWILCFFKEKIRIKHKKTLKSSDPRAHL